jgi:hypothetical protein
VENFVFITGKCILVPPSPKAALASLGLFYGIGVAGNADVEAYRRNIAQQYVATGKTDLQAAGELERLDSCIASY